MKTVFKYELIPGAGDLAVVELPVNAELLEVGFQGQQLCLWALVDTEEVGREQVTFLIKGTGHKIDDSIQWEHYVGTAIHPQVRLVIHVFLPEKDD